MRPWREIDVATGSVLAGCAAGLGMAYVLNGGCLLCG